MLRTDIETLDTATWLAGVQADLAMAAAPPMAQGGLPYYGVGMTPVQPVAPVVFYAPQGGAPVMYLAPQQPYPGAPMVAPQ
jgi:hypothetical protein